MFTPEPYSSRVCWIRSLTSWLMMPRSRLRIGESCERETTPRIADSATAWMVEVGSERLNRNSAGSRTFQTTWKEMSTMFSSPVSISPAEVPRTVPEPISSVFSRVTWTTSWVTIGQGAKLRPGSPMQSPRHSPKVSSTDCSSGRTL